MVDTLFINIASQEASFSFLPMMQYSKMAEPTTSESSPDTDRDFDPSVDMMVHDYDDERTIDEEENCSGESVENADEELDDLQKEGDMPIEELLAFYGYGPPASSGTVALPMSSPTAGSEHHDTRSSSEEEILSNQDLTLDKDEIARDLLNNIGDADRETSVNDLLDSVEPSQTERLLRSQNQADSSDESEDLDYEPVKEEDWKKTISVGSDYQVKVPEGLSHYGDAPAYENEDRLLWDDSLLEDAEVDKFLREVHKQNSSSVSGVNAIPTGVQVADDEQALYLLLQCDHNVEEALRRRKVQTVTPTDPMSLWSEEECRNFENGLRIYGKDFYLVQQHKVRTRSVGELVQFYYLWKKTERHDVFANKTRLEKKKYALHPGVTDYMDRFLDEDGHVPLPGRDRCSSPINSLIYADPKRHQDSEELVAALQMVQKVVDPTVFSPIKTSTQCTTTSDIGTAQPTVQSATVPPTAVQTNVPFTVSRASSLANSVPMNTTCAKVSDTLEEEEESNTPDDSTGSTPGKDSVDVLPSPASSPPAAKRLKVDHTTTDNKTTDTNDTSPHHDTENAPWSPPSTPPLSSTPHPVITDTSPSAFTSTTTNATTINKHVSLEIVANNLNSLQNSTDAQAGINAITPMATAQSIAQ